jgi:hypothetical protein
MASEVVLTIGVVLAAEWLFVRAAGALQVPVPPRAPAAMAAQLWMLNHALMVIAMMLGAILAMIGGFGIGMFATGRAQLVTILFLPVPMLALLAVGLTVHVRMLLLGLLAGRGRESWLGCTLSTFSFGRWKTLAVGYGQCVANPMRAAEL